MTQFMNLDTEAGARMRARRHEADARRLVALARAGRPAGTTGAAAGSWWRLRQAVGFGLVRTGLRLIDTGRA